MLRSPVSTFSLRLLLSGGTLACLLAAKPLHAQSAGDTLFAEAKFNQARTAYERSVRASPATMTNRYRLVETLLRLDAWPEAVKEGQAAVTQAPKDADAHGLYSLALMRGGKPDQALVEAQRSLALNPKSYWGLVATGRGYLWNEKEADARRILGDAIKANPTEPTAYYYVLSAFRDVEPDQADYKALRELERGYDKAYTKLNPHGHPHDRYVDAINNSLMDARAFQNDTPAKPGIGSAEAVPKTKPDETKNAADATKSDGSKPVATAKPDGSGKPDDAKKTPDAGKSGEATKTENKSKPAGKDHEGAVSITIPITRHDDDVLLPVKLANKSLTLLLDTGAGEGVVVTTDGMNGLYADSFGVSQARGVNGKEATRLYRAGDMRVGKLSFGATAFESTSADLKDSDGLIGGANFADFALTLDFEGNTMTLNRGAGASAPPAQEGNRLMTVPFRLAHGYIFVPVRYEDSNNTEWALLDTGAQGLGVLSLHKARELAKKRDKESTEEIELKGRHGIGNSSLTTKALVFGFGVTLRLVNSGGRPFAFELDPIYGATMMDEQVSRGFDFELSAIVGISYLTSAKRVTFDYPHHLLTMEFAEVATQ